MRISSLPALAEALLLCAQLPAAVANSQAKGGLGNIHVQHPIVPVTNPLTEEPVRPKRVAIVGAGSGGSSTAHYLRKFAAERGVPIEITIFEKNGYIGGRSTTVNVFNQSSEPVELGASIFVSVNHVLVNASNEFGLTFEDYRVRTEEAADSLGVYNGKQFVFNLPSESTWWSNLKIIWKYGLVPLHTQQLTKATVDKFLQLYNSPIFPFKDLTSAATDADLLTATSHTGEQFLELNKLGGKFATDLVQASTRVNYAQNLGLIHGLETMVSMAAEGAMSIKGGNWRIFEAMCNGSGAKVKLNTTVTSIQKNDRTGNWTVFSKPVEITTGIEGSHENTRVMATEEEFDSVVLASPYQFSELDISPPLKKVPDEIPYVKLYVTLFTSPLALSPAYFNLPVGTLVPSTILTTLNDTEQLNSTMTGSPGVDGVGSVGFYSISSLRKVRKYTDGDESGPYTIENLYKVFSPAEFGDDRIKEILGVSEEDGDKDAAISWTYRKIWHSYPVLFPRVTFEDIILDGHNETLFYTSGIESFISTMETSGLMGMNVAKLVVDSWEEKKEA